jgi:acyl-CoA reductase-like NAD-dependent aldehyde dehydrogenase
LRREEIVGSVISVITIKDKTEALAIASDSELGLGAGL